MQLRIVLLSVLALVLFDVISANTPRTCYSCKGINCMRTSVMPTKQCTDSLDYCVTVFDKCKTEWFPNNLLRSRIVSQFIAVNVIQKGCSYEVPEYLRKRCDANTAECHKCNTDRCNNLGQAEFKCVQCNSSQVTRNSTIGNKQYFK